MSTASPGRPAFWWLLRDADQQAVGRVHARAAAAGARPPGLLRLRVPAQRSLRRMGRVRPRELQQCHNQFHDIRFQHTTTDFSEQLPILWTLVGIPELDTTIGGPPSVAGDFLG